METFDELKTYMDEQGRITRWPTKRKTKQQQLILVYLAPKFESDRLYTEKEVNALLNMYHTFEDWAMLRRELFERGFLNREKDGSTYWVTRNTRFI